jgi:hypothetical protein
VHSNGPHQASSQAVGFASCITVLRQMCDKHTYLAFLAALDPETRAIVEAPPDADTWLPLTHWMRFLETAHLIAFSGSDDKITELSELGMMPDMQRIQTRAMRFTSPQFVITRAAKLWQSFCRNNGHVETSGASSNACEVHYINVYSARVRAFLPFQRGVAHAILKMCGRERFSVRCLPVVDPARQTLAADWQD